ncbi:MAG: aldose epimerase family protein [Qingshengfaniella sp.]
MTRAIPFGTYPSGETALTATLRAGPLRCQVLSHGASLRQLEITLPDGPRNIALGLGNLAAYIAHGAHIGATCGRYAGKIPDALVEIDGRPVTLSRNADGRHHVHGGVLGLGRRNWRLEALTGTMARFRILSPDGDEGYPGALDVTCTYRLSVDALRITYSATTTQDTPLNLLHHGYFNLDGAGTIGAHRLEIASSALIERDAAGHPTGQRQPLDKPYDFSRPRPVGNGSGIDDTYILCPDQRSEPALAARLTAGRGDLRMDVHTTETGLHVYDGGKLNIPAPGNPDGQPLMANAGICLEPTSGLVLRDDGSATRYILAAGQTYRQVTVFRLMAL